MDNSKSEFSAGGAVFRKRKTKNEKLKTTIKNLKILNFEM